MPGGGSGCVEVDGLFPVVSNVRISHAAAHRLALPRVMGAIMDAFSGLDWRLFRTNLAIATQLVAADVVLSTWWVPGGWDDCYALFCSCW